MWPSRWFTAPSGRRRARAIALAVATPPRSAPASPGPRVTARASISRHVAPACSRASSMMGLSRSTWAREASSGTTPPNRAWMSCWLESTLDRTLTPSSTTAAAVSSHDVSMPRTFIRSPGPSWPGAHALRNLVDDPLEDPVVVGGADVVGPHDQGVLVGLLVVALAHPDGAEPEMPVQPLGRPVRHPNLQRHGGRSHSLRPPDVAALHPGDLDVRGSGLFQPDRSPHHALRARAAQLISASDFLTYSGTTCSGRSASSRWNRGTDSSRSEEATGNASDTEANSSRVAASWSCRRYRRAPFPTNKESSPVASRSAMIRSGAPTWYSVSLVTPPGT